MFEDGHLRPTTPGAAALAPQISAFEAELANRGFNVAAQHYHQAVDNFTDGNFEACNGQLRSYMEDFFVRLCRALTGHQTGNPNAALQTLRGNHLDDEEWNIFRYFWGGIQDNGPHAGLTNAEEAFFRLHTATAAGRYLLRKR